jgi:transposase
MAELAGRLDELRATDAILVGDSKLCTVATLAQAAELGFPLITMLPETFAWRKEFIGYASKDPELPHLMTTESGETYHGKSWKFPVLIKNQGKPNRIVWLRCLVIHSSQLAEKRGASRHRQVAKERKVLDSFAARMQETVFACEADARKVINRDWKSLKPKFHSMILEVEQKEVLAPRKKPGRPPKNSPPHAFSLAWKGTIRIEEISRRETAFDPDGFFVLLTSITDRRRSDAQLLAGYKGQQVVEISFKWLKGPLATAPLFLALPSRIQAIGFVLLLAILFSALLQRDLRKGAKKRGGKVPNYPGRRSDKPTWQGFLALFEGVRLTSVSIGSKIHRAFHHLDADQMELLSLLGVPTVYEEYSNAVYT